MMTRTEVFVLRVALMSSVRVIAMVTFDGRFKDAEKRWDRVIKRTRIDAWSFVWIPIKNKFKE